ncbi:MAG TPA: hypothetical protein VF933_36140 [Streptosporangiaceae bacterium]
MPHLFFNGPVQNGDFTFAAKPGKAVGIRIAGALNRILGAPVAPHLWNTVTLAGDLRYLQHIEAARAPIAREDFEAAIIAAKYGDGPQPPAGTATDTDKSVADLAMTMITERLSLGVLRLTDETIFECARCGHMIGTRHHHCRACGHDISHTRIARHLTSDRKPGENVLDFTRIHARKRRPPFHLQNIAANTPTRLILSRTRSHGIDLSPVGLPGLVLDPRVGVHIAVLAAARTLRADSAAMTITENAAANIAAYGQYFAEHEELRLLYALHGHVPYQHVPDLHDTSQAHGLGPDAMGLFTDWFLPLFSLREKKDVQADQLPALLKYFRRTILTKSSEPSQDILEDIRQSIREGDTGWIMRKTALAAAMRTMRMGGRRTTAP